MNIPLSRPDITEEEVTEVVKVLKTPNLSLGPVIPEFEQKIADFAGVKYAVAMSSGTAVLHVLVKALGIGKGDYVLTTPFSFISTANCVIYENAEPIFVDIDKETYNITPEKCAEVYHNMPANMRRRVKALIYVDVFGVPANGLGFELFGRENGLYVVEDSAEAIGAQKSGRHCGSFGDAGLFAFYPNKQITTGEGGVLVTNNEKLAILARSLRNQGRDAGMGWLQHARLGFNYRISDISCALGLAQLKRIDEILGKRKRVKEMYDRALITLIEKGSIFLQKTPNDCVDSPFVYTVRLNDAYHPAQRDELLDFLRTKGINCSNYFTPIHLQPVFSSLGWEYGDFPVTEQVAERTVALPFYNALSKKDIVYIADALQKWFSQQ